MNKLLLKIIIIIFTFCLYSCKEESSTKDSTLFLTINNGNLYSIDLLTGKCNWQNIKNIQDTRSDTYFSINKNTIIKSYEDGQVIVFNKQSGVIIKKYQENESIPENPSLFMFSQYPLIHNNNFIYSNLNGKVRSVNLSTMQQSWESDVKNKVFFSPAIIGNKVIVNTGYSLCAINAKNGKFITFVEFTSPLPQEPVINDGEIFVIDEEGNAFCFDENLKTKWQFQIIHNINTKRYDEDAKVNITTGVNIETLTNLALGEKRIVIGDSKHIIGIDKKTGEMKWLATIPVINWELPDDVALVKKNLQKGQDLHSILNDKIGELKSSQIIDKEFITNTSSCIAVYNVDNGNLKRKKFFFSNEIIGGIKATNDFYYYLRKDGSLYKIDKTLKTETIVYKGISYKPEEGYTSPYIQIE